MIAAHRAMWSITNYFLVNLTLTDLMMSIFNCIPSFIFMRDRWVVGGLFLFPALNYNSGYEDETMSIELSNLQILDIRFCLL